MCCGRKPSRKKKIPPKTRVVKTNRSPDVTAQSTHLKTFVLCRPDYFGIHYSINPWMKLENQSNSQKVVEQYNYLCDRIEEFHGKIVNVKPREGLPDMVFTANAGLYLKEHKSIVLSNFKHEERQKEQAWFFDFFTQLEIKVHVPMSVFEGAGDALFLGEKLVGAYGFRSEESIYREIRPLLASDPVVVRLTDDRFYHLDTCFCPLENNDYMIFPGAFESSGLEAIRALGGNEIEVPENEACQFACNAVQIGQSVIMPTGCPVTMDKLSKAGYKPSATDMGEFLKSGGACKCLTLQI
jgi:N-dimethylarginine dimethylaminohydrolase